MNSIALGMHGAYGSEMPSNQTTPLRCVDYFAGLGGWSEGARSAGARVLMAINHWRRAVDTHTLNHPETMHECQDLGLYDATQLPDHDLLIASPSCVGHTPARGKERPHHDETRATAWCVVTALEAKRPPFFVVENVPAFQNWELFGVWEMACAALGYSVRPHVVDASEWGVPQQRVRLIITGSRIGAAPQLVTPNLPGQHAREIIDWNRGEWSRVGRRAARTMTCIRHGRANFGDRFLVPYFGSTVTSRSVDRPIGTITTKDRYLAVDGGRCRMLLVEEYRRAMSFPDSYVLTGTQTEQKKMLGNAVPPVLARGIIEQIARVAA